MCRTRVSLHPFQVLLQIGFFGPNVHGDQFGYQRDHLLFSFFTFSGTVFLKRTYKQLLNQVNFQKAVRQYLSQIFQRVKSAWVMCASRGVVLSETTSEDVELNTLN